jgi:tetratricopeptide (TPR) repeat protein
MMLPQKKFAAGYAVKTAAGILAAACIAALMIGFNDVNIHLRIAELKLYFQKSIRDENSSDHMALLTKMHIQKNLYSSAMTPLAADMMELKVNTLFAQIPDETAARESRYKKLIPVMEPVINGIRFMLGKPPVSIADETMRNRCLDAAYYFERNNAYSKAVDLFTKAEKAKTEDREILAGILLHKGFCFAVMGNSPDAVTSFKKVISVYSGEKAAFTAGMLLRYIEGFSDEASKILSQADSTNKAEKLFYLIAYRESLSVLDRVRSTATPEEKARITFFTGRCLESLGETDKALKTYQSIITGNPSDEYARRANRRIFIEGAARGSETVRDLAKRNNELISDPDFTAMQDADSKLTALQSSTARPELMREFKNIISSYDASYAAIEKNAEELSARSRIEEQQHGRSAQKTEGSGAVKISTRTGNVFVGTISEETSDSIVVTTGFGKVRILKSDIAKRDNAK